MLHFDLLLFLFKSTRFHTCLAKMNTYEYLFFDEVIIIHVEVPFKTNFKRYDFLQKIALSIPEVCSSIILFIWKVQTDSNVKEIIDERTKTIEKKTRLFE